MQRTYHNNKKSLVLRGLIYLFLLLLTLQIYVFDIRNLLFYTYSNTHFITIMSDFEDILKKPTKKKERKSFLETDESSASDNDVNTDDGTV